MQELLVLILLLCVHPTLSVVTVGETGPIVNLSYGTFQGSSTGGIDQFLGIPYAQAERFGLPHLPSNKEGIQQAASFGAACPQQNSEPSIPGLPPIPPPALNISEDCLFINIVRPSNIPANHHLPVVVWLFGGGWEEDDSSQFDGSTVVSRSVALQEPVIYVSINFRLSAYGFSGSKEIKAAGVGNLGLRDQRFAMQWVQDNICLFRGDREKVTLWGQSSGAISIALHFLVNGGDIAGLFRGAFMLSGSPILLEDITAGQPFFDKLVVETGCSGSNDVLACLKTVPFDIFQNAVNQSPGPFSFLTPKLAWLPRVDGVFLTEDPLRSVLRGAYARVPLVSGDCDDEGTLFALSQLNLTTDTEAIDFLHQDLLPQANDSQFQSLISLYPSDPTQGSPFDTGTANQITPVFKRMAAFEGDIRFQAPRRFFLQVTSKTQNTWGFLFKRGKNIPGLGAFHGSDIPEFFSSTPNPDFRGTDALINFINHLNPNIGSQEDGSSTLIHWPKYSTNVNAPPLLTFLDPNNLSITPDTFRVDAMAALTSLQREFS